MIPKQLRLMLGERISLDSRAPVPRTMSTGCGEVKLVATGKLHPYVLVSFVRGVTLQARETWTPTEPQNF